MLKNKNHIKIKLSERFRNSIASRVAIINLFDVELSDVKTLEVDFSDIAFVSRSATHQFIKEKERIEKELHIKVDFSNLCKEVRKNFEIVIESIEAPKPVISSIHRVHFSTQKDFQSFLAGV